MHELALSSRSGDAFFGLSLCAGVGGIDLGLTIACPKYRTVCYVERESYAAATHSIASKRVWIGAIAKRPNSPKRCFGAAISVLYKRLRDYKMKEKNMGLSQRAYARQRGVSHTAVRKAIASGRISVLADGTIDPDKADRQWDTQTDPSKQRGPRAHALGTQTKSATRKAVPKAAIRSVDDTLREAGEVPAGGGEVSFLRAKMANEVLKAQTAKVRLAKMKEELVDRAKATSMVFELARRERDAWQNWPPRVAADMAAELGVEAHAMEHVLDKHLRKHLADMAEIAIELR